MSKFELCDYRPYTGINLYPNSRIPIVMYPTQIPESWFSHSDGWEIIRTSKNPHYERILSPNIKYTRIGDDSCTNIEIWEQSNNSLRKEHRRHLHASITARLDPNLKELIKQIAEKEQNLGNCADVLSYEVELTKAITAQVPKLFFSEKQIIVDNFLNITTEKTELANDIFDLKDIRDTCDWQGLNSRKLRFVLSEKSFIIEVLNEEYEGYYLVLGFQVFSKNLVEHQSNIFKALKAGKLNQDTIENFIDYYLRTELKANVPFIA